MGESVEGWKESVHRCLIRTSSVHAVVGGPMMDNNVVDVVAAQVAYIITLKQGLELNFTLLPHHVCPRVDLSPTPRSLERQQR